MRKVLPTIVMLLLVPVLLGKGSCQIINRAEAQQKAPAKHAVQDLDEMVRRKARLGAAAWPYADLDKAYSRTDWQPETLCFADTKTGREVWRMTATPNIRNYYHNDIAVSPWSADGRRMGLQSWRAERGREVRNLWMVVDTTGRHMRPTVNNSGYMHWSPLVPDTYYTFGGARFLSVKSQNNILYAVTVTDEDAKAMKPLITYPQVPGASYGNRKFISSDGKMFVAMLSVRNRNWRRDGGAEYEMFFTPSIVFPEDKAKALLKKGYTVNRDFGDYIKGPYTKGRYHDAYLLGDASYYYVIDKQLGYWRIKTLGSAPDGGAKFTGDDGKHNFGEMIPEFVRKKGKRNDPWGKNAIFVGHPGFDRWGEMVSIANYDGKDKFFKGTGENWKMGATVYDFTKHRPITGDFWVQSDGCTHCDWHAYADYAVVSIEKSKYSFGPARIECFAHDKVGKNFIVCYTNNFTNGGKSYYNYIRPAQSPDGTKVAFHSDFLNSKASPDAYWAVCYYPKPPTDLQGKPENGGVKLTWEMPTYTKRGWPTKNDPPPPAREIKAFHVWRAPDAGGPWKEIGKVDVEYKVNEKRSIMEPTTLEFIDRAGRATGCYALTSEEHSGLESQELSEILQMTAAGSRVAAKAGQKDFWKTPPAAPTNVRLVKGDQPGHHLLSWDVPADDKVRYYNVYYSTDGTPEAKQANRIASLPGGTKQYLDWLADPAKDGHYTITSVDRQGNESPPAAAVAKQGAHRYHAEPVPTYAELDKGERLAFHLHDGTEHAIQLVDYDKTSATLRVDGEEQVVKYRPQDLPVTVAGMRLGVEITKAWSDRKRFNWFGLKKDCRLFLSDASRPVMSGPEGVFPLSPPSKMTRGSMWGSGWLANRREAQKDCHIGYDIYGPLGTKLVAIEDVEVRDVWVDKDYGDMIVVDLEGKRLRYRYLHLMKALVTRGQKLKRGDDVGLIGQTGYCIYPHLHLQIMLPRAEASRSVRSDAAREHYFKSSEFQVNVNPAPYVHDMYARLEPDRLVTFHKVVLKAVDPRGDAVKWPHWYVTGPDGKTHNVGVHNSTSVRVGENPFTFTVSKKRLRLRGKRTARIEKDRQEVVVHMQRTPEAKKTKAR